MGKVIIKDFIKQKDGSFKGTVFAPHWEKTFKGKITIQSNDEIHLRGYLGTPLLGSTQTWMRVKNIEQ